MCNIPAPFPAFPSCLQLHVHSQISQPVSKGIQNFSLLLPVSVLQSSQGLFRTFCGKGLRKCLFSTLRRFPASLLPYLKKAPVLPRPAYPAATGKGLVQRRIFHSVFHPLDKDRHLHTQFFQMPPVLLRQLVRKEPVRIRHLQITITASTLHRFKHTLPFSCQIFLPVHACMLPCARMNIPLKDPVFPSVYGINGCSRTSSMAIAVSSGDQFTATVDHRLHCLIIVFAAQLVHMPPQLATWSGPASAFPLIWDSRPGYPCAVPGHSGESPGSSLPVHFVSSTTPTVSPGSTLPCHC